MKPTSMINRSWPRESRKHKGCSSDLKKKKIISLVHGHGDPLVLSHLQKQWGGRRFSEQPGLAYRELRVCLRNPFSNKVEKERSRAIPGSNLRCQHAEAPMFACSYRAVFTWTMCHHTQWEWKKQSKAIDLYPVSLLHSQSGERHPEEARRECH